MERSVNTVKHIFMLIGIVFILTGAILIILSLRMNVRIDNSRQVTASVVDVIETREWHRKNHGKYYTKMYTSVYEYYDGGEMKTYKSSVSTSKRAEIGSEATLYISEDGKIYERLGASLTLILGAGFSVMGGFFTFISVKIQRKIFAGTEE